MIQMNLFIKRNRFTDMENRLVVAKGKEGHGETWIGSFGLADARHYIYIMDGQ